MYIHEKTERRENECDELNTVATESRDVSRECECAYLLTERKIELLEGRGGLVRC